MDQLQFGRHDQLAANNAGFIGEALTISSLGAGLLSTLVHTALTASLFLVFRRTYKLSVDAATVGMICAGRATDECSASRSAMPLVSGPAKGGKPIGGTANSSAPLSGGVRFRDDLTSPCFAS